MKQTMFLSLGLGIILLLVLNGPVLADDPDITGTWAGTKFTIIAPPIPASVRGAIKLELTEADDDEFTGDVFLCGPPVPCDLPPNPQATVELFFIKGDAFLIEFEDPSATGTLQEPCVTSGINPVPSIITGTGSLNQDQTTMTFLVSNRNSDCVPEITTATLDRQP